MSHASPAPRSVEEQAYLDKLQKLSRYVEPLRRMIKRLSTDKDEGNLQTKVPFAVICRPCYLQEF